MTAPIKIAAFQRELNNLIDRIQKPDSNNVTERDIAFALYTAAILEGAAKPLLKAKDKVKAAYSDRLKEPVSKFDLITTPELIVQVKVDAGRNSFDKDAFITTLVTQYGLSAKALYDLADTTVKTTAPVVTITTELA